MKTSTFVIAALFAAVKAADPSPREAQLVADIKAALNTSLNSFNQEAQDAIDYNKSTAAQKQVLANEVHQWLQERAEVD